LSHNRLLQCCSAAISLLKLVCKLLHNHTNTHARTPTVFYPFVLFFALLGFVLIMVLGKGSWLQVCYNQTSMLVLWHPIAEGPILSLNWGLEEREGKWSSNLLKLWSIVQRQEKELC
jgi:hypothetical protein